MTKPFAPVPAAVAVLLVLAGLSQAPLAQPPSDAPPAVDEETAGGGFLEVPDTASEPYSGDNVGTPEVTIKETETEVIYEYRIRGRVYMVRIDPIVGPPYYLLDTNGDGVLDVQENRAPGSVPQWLLFNW